MEQNALSVSKSDRMRGHQMICSTCSDWITSRTSFGKDKHLFLDTILVGGEREREIKRWRCLTDGGGTKVAQPKLTWHSLRIQLFVMEQNSIFLGNYSILNFIFLKIRPGQDSNLEKCIPSQICRYGIPPPFLQKIEIESHPRRLNSAPGNWTFEIGSKAGQGQK